MYNNATLFFFKLQVFLSCLLASRAANDIFSSAQNANAKGENVSAIFVYTDFHICNEITRTLHVIKSDCQTRSDRSLKHI